MPDVFIRLRLFDFLEVVSEHPKVVSEAIARKYDFLRT